MIHLGSFNTQFACLNNWCEKIMILFTLFYNLQFTGHAIICNNSPTQNCSIDTDGSCKCTCKKGYYSEENGGCHKGTLLNILR